MSVYCAVILLMGTLIALNLHKTKYTNVIEKISPDKMLIRDVADGKLREMRFTKYAAKDMEESLKYSRVGDTIVVTGTMLMYDYSAGNAIRGNTASTNGVDHAIHFNRQLINKRKSQEYKRRQQIGFDPWELASAYKNQEKQR